MIKLNLSNRYATLWWLCDWTVNHVEKASHSNNLPHWNAIVDAAAVNVLRLKVFTAVCLCSARNFTLKWNKICFPDIQKCHYCVDTNRTTCWCLRVSRWSCCDESASVSDSHSPGPSINVIFALRFVMAYIMTLFPFDDADRRKKKQMKKKNTKGMTQEITPLSENVMVSQKHRESLYAVSD